MARQYGYKDFNITTSISPTGNAWEFVSVVSGPMHADALSIEKIVGAATVATEDEAYFCAYEAATKHIDNN